MTPFSSSWQYLLPQHALSRLTAKLANCQWPWLKNWLISQFIAAYHVNMQEAIDPNPSHYASFNHFFTRGLKPGVRSIDNLANAMISPVDGCISQVGTVKQGRIFQAKQVDFSLLELLGGNQDRASLFQEASFATLYLAPRDYHRVHMPLGGELEEMIYVPGKLFSVNHRSVKNIPRLFARNERAVCFFKTAFGPMALILVGAMIVAGIETVWAGNITPTPNRVIQKWPYSGRQIALEKGAEMGRFQLGSTVIILLADNKFKWSTELLPDKKVQLGERLGLSVY